jgi:1-acyl-sn-glycerol-3-phosphate acyltransferase
MDKIINATCACGDYVSSIKRDSILLEPCEHILHFKCSMRIKNSRCPLCSQKVNKIFTYKEIQSIWRKTKNNKFYQRYVDMVSIKYMWDTGSVDPFRALMNLPLLSMYSGRLFFCKNFNDIHLLIKDIIELANIKIKIKGTHNLSKHTKVLIVNHTMELDALIIGYVFKCGFLASSQITKTWYGKKLSKTTPIILIDRGKSKNTVGKIKEFMTNKKKDVCIFPEGFLTHHNTIATFRSGAFNTDFPIQPIVIKYDPPINDDNPVCLITKIFSQKEITVTIKILPLELPPFSKEKVEIIRNKMGKAGNMALSRVSNRDIKD